MPASNDWSLYELTPVVDFVYKYIANPDEILRLAVRAGCEEGDIERSQKPREQWENAFIFAVGDGKLEDLFAQVQKELPRDRATEFTRCMQSVSGRRLVSLLGKDYTKFGNAIDEFLQEEDHGRQIELAENLRRTAIKLYREFNNDISWQAVTPIKTSAIEIRSMRQRFRVLCINIVTSAEYLLAIARPYHAKEGVADSDSPVERTRLATRRAGNSRSDEDEQLRRIVDARITLFVEADQLWNALKESVALPPDG
jgi:hypothetical protein